MAQKDSRFVKVLEDSGFISSSEIWVDTQTGVQYLYHASGYSGGMTVWWTRRVSPSCTASPPTPLSSEPKGQGGKPCPFSYASICVLCLWLSPALDRTLMAAPSVGAGVPDGPFSVLRLRAAPASCMYASGGHISFNSERNMEKNAAKNHRFLDFPFVQL